MEDLEVDRTGLGNQVMRSSKVMESGPIVTVLHLDRYKTEICPKKCRSKRCLYYHSEKDFRRSFRHNYESNQCQGNCPTKQCRHAKNIAERKYHFLNYKKTYCKNFVLSGNCMYGECCSSAHSDEELRVRPLHLMPIDLDFLFFHFKSQFCPYTLETHDTFSCVFAHNWQDFKRPYFPGQIPQNCSSWSPKKQVDSYEQGCATGLSCRYCHGWKEYEYHPERFKQKNCNKCLADQLGSAARPLSGPSDSATANVRAINKHLCSFRHSESEIVPRKSDFFELVARRTSYGKVSTSEFFSCVFPEGRRPPGAFMLERTAPPDKLVDFFAFLARIPAQSSANIELANSESSGVFSQLSSERFSLTGVSTTNNVFSDSSLRKKLTDEVTQPSLGKLPSRECNPGSFNVPERGSAADSPVDNSRAPNLLKTPPFQKPSLSAQEIAKSAKHKLCKKTTADNSCPSNLPFDDPL